MNKDKIEGAVKRAVGTAKEATGKAVGNAKLENAGTAEKVAGMVQGAVGGAKDALKK